MSSSIADVWTDAADHAISGKVAGAATELLQANTKLDRWTESRIRRVDYPDEDGGGTCPDIQVAGVSFTQNLLAGNAADLDVLIGILVRWDAQAREMTLTEPGIDTVFAEIQRALETNPKLEDTTVAPGVALALSFQGVETVGIQPEDTDGDNTNHVALLATTWVVKVEATTRRLH